MGLERDYEQKCATCSYYYLGEKEHLRIGKGFECDVWSSAQTPNNTCNKYRKAYGRSDSYISSSLRMINRGYYILTALGDILNWPIDNIYVNTFCLLEKHFGYIPSFSDLLQKYDEIAPHLAHYLLSDENNIEVAYYLVDEFVKPSFDLICDGNINDGIRKYVQMILYLETKYNCKDVFQKRIVSR